MVMDKCIIGGGERAGEFAGQSQPAVTLGRRSQQQQELAAGENGGRSSCIQLLKNWVEKVHVSIYTAQAYSSDVGAAEYRETPSVAIQLQQHS